MRLIICDSYEDMSAEAAKIVSSQLTIKPASILGLATGSTPVGMYNILGKMCRNDEVDFSEAKSFNLDEYYPIKDDNPQSYHYFMQENLFSKINIKKENTHILNGMCEDTEAECKNFENMIAASGGIDLQILGIGQNGHIGFNEPDANLNPDTHLTSLTESTVNANSRFFDSIGEVPTKALTMGIGTILKAKKIILLASGESKHKVVKELLEGKITTDVPASMLKVHSDVVLICDKAAYYSERIGVDIGGTDIKFGVLNDSNEIIYKESIPTPTESEESLIGAIADKYNEIMQTHSINGIGVGTPGIIRNGMVTAANLPFKNTKLESEVSRLTGCPVRIGNDANCAALGEAVVGVGKGVKNVVMVTLGTGIGGGIVINGKLYHGKGSAGEIGHMIVEKDGKQCGCGQRGCWEKYASVTALTELASEKAKQNRDSELYKLMQNGGLNGEQIFKAAANGDETAKSAIDEYLDNVAAGIDSLVRIFEPDMIILSGGITNAGEKLIEPLCKKVTNDVLIKLAALKNSAGIVGAALLQ